MRFNSQVFALSIASTAIVAGCAQFGRQSAVPNSQTQSTVRRGSTQEQQFSYTGGPQYFTVPDGVTNVTITALGGGNGDRKMTGGLVIASIPVTPDEQLAVYVGGSGLDGGHGTFNNGGYNGGGGAVWQLSPGAGASDVREGGTSLQNRVVVAGGAGGRGDIYYGTDGGLGGYGGGGGRSQSGGVGHGGGCHKKILGPQCHAQPGAGGTLTAGGAGGAGGVVVNGGNGMPGEPGTFGVGGDGGLGGGQSPSGGGGGGGGYYGGGGGGGGGSQPINGRDWIGSGGGGGGGSAYIEPSGKKIKILHGVGATGDGEVTITWTASH